MGLPETAAGSSFIGGVPIVQWRRRALVQPGVIGFGRTLLFLSQEGALRAKDAGGKFGEGPAGAGRRVRLVGLAEIARGCAALNELPECRHRLIVAAKVRISPGLELFGRGLAVFGTLV